MDGALLPLASLIVSWSVSGFCQTGISSYWICSAVPTAAPDVGLKPPGAAEAVKPPRPPGNEDGSSSDSSPCNLLTAVKVKGCCNSQGAQKSRVCLELTGRCSQEQSGNTAWVSGASWEADSHLDVVSEHVTPAMLPAAPDGGFGGAVEGGEASVCGRTVALPERMDGWMVTAAFVALVQVPPQRTRARGHLSANAAWEAEAGLEFLNKGFRICLSRTDSLAYRHWWDIPTQLGGRFASQRWEGGGRMWD